MKTKPTNLFQDDHAASDIERRLRACVSQDIWKTVMSRAVPAVLIFTISGCAFLEVFRRILPQSVLESPVIVLLATTAILFPVVIFSIERLLALAVSLQMAHLEVLGVLSTAIAERDGSTSEHNLRVAIMAVRLAIAIGLDRRLMSGLISGGLLHDVGKIGIPDRILRKPGKLSIEERQEMESHVLYGDKILATSAWLRRAGAIAHSHHERYDGSGYPDGRKGSEIPPEARLFAIVDVFDALVSERPYKQPMSLDEAMAVMECGRGTHFDPAYLDAFKTLARALYDDVICATPEALREFALNLIEKHYAFEGMPWPDIAGFAWRMHSRNVRNAAHGSRRGR